MLRGDALGEDVAGARILTYFPVSTLPEEPAHRFRLLFAAKPHWTREEIEPYLHGLQVRRALKVCSPPPRGGAGVPFLHDLIKLPHRSSPSSPSL